MKTRPIFLIAILFAATTALYAQSGRRSTGSSTTTTTTTTPSVSGSKTTEKKPPAAPKVQLLVGIDRGDTFIYTPYYVFDTVLDVCIRRLGEADIVFANSAGNNMTRADAVRAAKQEKVRWVAQLDVRSIYSDTGRIKNNDEELYVTYVLIEPETGKIKHSGQSRQHIYQNGKGGISMPKKNGAIYSEYSIKQAAIEIADRILADFDITVRPASRF